MKYDMFNWRDIENDGSIDDHACKIPHSDVIGGIAKCSICSRVYYAIGPILSEAMKLTDTDYSWVYTDLNGKTYLPDEQADDMPPSIFDTIGDFSDLR